MSHLYQEYMHEQEQRRAALLDMPNQIAETFEQLSKANSVGSRVKDHLMGGVIGAILSAIVSKLAG